RPVKYLQALVVLSGTCAAATFFTPALMMAYWRRATAPGVIAAMLAGSGTMATLFGLGALQRFALQSVADGSASPLMAQAAAWLGPDPAIGIAHPLRSYYVFGLDPLMWALPIS